MKQILLIASVLFFQAGVSGQSNAVTKSPSAAAAFIKTVNDLLQAAPKVSWSGNDPLRIDSLFHMVGDSISYTLYYKSNTGAYRVRFIAPFSQIERVESDYYFLLIFGSNKVNIYSQAYPSATWILEEQSAMLHIARVEDVSDHVKALHKKAEAAFAKWKGTAPVK